MLRKKNKASEKNPLNSKSPPAEFSERVSKLLLACIEGIQKLISEKETFYSTLANLKEVVKKAVRPQPLSGIGKDIEDFFDRLVLEKKFRQTKNEAINQIVSGLTETVKGMVDSSTEFDQEMEKCIKDIVASEKEEEINALKEYIIEEINKVRESSGKLVNELEGYRKTTQSLSRKLQHTEAKALVDPLTNVLNRNAYNIKIGQMMLEFEKFGEVFGILVIDIDHFKKFNDQYGHRAGDRVLNSVAGSLKGVLRASDMIFRYGGEEFVVLLKNINLPNAEKLGEKLRAQIERDYFVDREKELKVAVSIGVTVSKEGDTEETLFERADQVMYEAKRKGRNRVEVAE